jgi:hypothetical protein
MTGSGNRSFGRDAAGIALFGVAVFAVISMVLALTRPVESPQGTTAAIGSVLGAIGAVPGLALALAVAAIGARVWLQGRIDHLARDLAGAVGTTLGLAVLAGAVAPEAGGAVGAWTGAKVASFLTPFVGVPFGLVCVMIPIWFAWVRPRELIAWDLGQAERGGVAEGVTPEEARALLPRVEEVDEPEPPLSPYPLDVRLQGRIPEGTRPIEATEPSAVRPRPPAPRSSMSPGSPVQPESAGAGTAAEPIDRAPRAAPPEPDTAEPAPADTAPVPEYPEPELPERRELHRKVASPTARASEARPIEPPILPSPSWEQGGLFEAEPVDAYGTPISIVASIREDLGAQAPLVGGESLVQEPDPSIPSAPEGDAAEPGGWPAGESDLAEEDLSAEEEPSTDEDAGPLAEREVEIVPLGSPRELAESGEFPSSDLVHRAGLLFLERGRVAVSMLQREYGLDFGQATLVLDRLQEQGLIGPYSGGQRRDILLSAEEWRQRA